METVIVAVRVTIKGTREAVWRAVAGIDRAADIIGGIQGIEILERPASGLVGLRWNETRLLFDKPATVEKRIIEAVENVYYVTRADSHGFEFLTMHRLSGADDGVALEGIHESRPRTLLARLQTVPMRLFFKGTLEKAIRRDLEDIRAAVERP